MCAIELGKVVAPGGSSHSDARPDLNGSGVLVSTAEVGVSVWRFNLRDASRRWRPDLGFSPILPLVYVELCELRGSSILSLHFSE